MLKLKPSRSAPPGGKYWYTVPETGAFFEHRSSEVLVEHVKGHYGLNNLSPPGDLWERIQHQMCLELSPQTCEGSVDGDERRPRLTISGLRSFTRLVFDRATAAVGLKDSIYVDTAEAERRANICVNHQNLDGTAGCKNNFQGVCTTCNGLGDFAAKFLVDPSRQKTSLDSKLGACVSCGCLLTAKVHIKKELILRSDPRSKYPPHCWLAVNSKEPSHER